MRVIKRWEGTGGRTDLAGSVDNITIILDTLVIDALRESTLDGGVIGFYEMVLDVLHDEGGLAWNEDRA